MHDVINAFRDSRSTSEQGTQFEQLMVRWFELDPTLNEQYDKVWRWPDWPGRHNHGDNGIDIVAHVAETGPDFGTEDEFAAIQCKFYDPEHYLAKSDIDSFFTESVKAPLTRRVIISTTDRWGKNAEAALEGPQIPVTRISMKDLEDSPVSWDIAWPQNTLQVDLPHELRPHQEEAVNAVFRGWGDCTTGTTTDRGKLIMACGTGKTFTSRWSPRSSTARSTMDLGQRSVSSSGNMMMCAHHPARPGTGKRGLGRVGHRATYRRAD